MKSGYCRRKPVPDFVALPNQLFLNSTVNARQKTSTVGRCSNVPESAVLVVHLNLSCDNQQQNTGIQNREIREIREKKMQIQCNAKMGCKSAFSVN